MSGISVKLPLQYDSEDGPYELNKTITDTVKQNLKMIVLTDPGERVMNPRFGAGIKRMLFENVGSPQIGAVKNAVTSQINKYLPFVELVDIIVIEPDGSSVNENSIQVKIQYYIKPLKASDILEIILNP